MISDLLKIIVIGHSIFIEVHDDRFQIQNVDRLK